MKIFILICFFLVQTKRTKKAGIVGKYGKCQEMLSNQIFPSAGNVCLPQSSLHLDCCTLQ